MASLERRGNRYHVIFRLGGMKHHVGVNAADRKDAEAGLARLEENLRLVERGRLAVPDGADLGLSLLTDGRLEKKVGSAGPSAWRRCSRPTAPCSRPGRRSRSPGRWRTST